MNQEGTQKSSTAAAGRPSRTRALLKKLLGWAIALACLAWVFHDVKFDELTSHMSSIVWGWVALAIAFDLVSYVIQGHRWKMLLRPTGDISVLRTTQAIYVGLFTNEIVPLRVGELVRMFLVSRWMKTEFISILPSYMVERMLDAIWLGVAVGLAVLFVPLPRQLLVGEQVLVGFILVSTVAFVFAVVKKGRARGVEEVFQTPAGKGHPLSSDAPASPRDGAADGESTDSTPAESPRRRNPFRVVSRFIDEMAGGLHQIGLSRNFFIAALGSLGLLVFQILSYWLVMPAMDIHLSVWQGTVAFLILRMGTALPNTPSNVGSYQFFAVVGLEIFGVDKTTAASFSVVSFVLLTIPLWVVGLIALWRTGMSFSAIRSEVAKLGGSRGGAVRSDTPS